MTEITVDKHNRWTSVSLRWGGLSAALLIIFNLIAFIALPTDNPDNFAIGEIVGYTAIILSLTLLYKASAAHYAMEPDATYWSVVVTTLAAGIVTSFAFGAYNVFYVEVLDPEFMDTYFTYYIDEIRASGAADAEAQIAALQADRAMFESPLTQFIVMGMTVLAIAIPVSLITAWIAKPRKD